MTQEYYNIGVFISPFYFRNDNFINYITYHKAGRQNTKNVSIIIGLIKENYVYF